MRLRAQLSILACGLFLLFVLTLRMISEYVTPFVLALFLAAVIDPLVDKLEKVGVPRGLSALLLIGTFTLGVAVAAWVVCANLIREIQLFADQLPELSDRLHEIVARLQGVFERLLTQMPTPITDGVKEGVSLVAAYIGGLPAQLIGVAGALPHLFAVTVVTAMSTYFVSRDKRGLARFLMRFVPRGWRAELLRLKDEILAGLIGFVKAQAVLMALSASLSILGLSLFGYPYAWALGAFAGVLDLAPMVGPSGVFAPLVAAGLIFGDWMRTIGIACVWAVVLIVRQVIEPEIVGRHVGIHPLTSVAAVYLGVKLMGLNGILFGPVLAVTIKAVVAVSILPHLARSRR